MQLHFTATGNFQGLTSNLQTMNTQVNRTMTGAGTAFAKATHPLNQLNRQLETTGRLTARQAMHYTRHGGQIIRQSNAIRDSVTRAYTSAAGESKVFMDINRATGNEAIAMGQKFRYAMTMVHGLGKGMIAAGKQIQWAGRQITVGLTVPMLLLGRVAGNAAEEYNRQFTRILKVNNDASQAAMHSAEMFEVVSESIRKQSDALMEYGANMGFVAAETSKMVAELSQMGFAGSALDMLSEQSIKLSRISGTDLTTSLELARLSAQAFGIELNDLEETFARLNLVENNTALSLDELAQAFPVVAGVAATMGVSVEETAGLLAMMKENGIGANEGATALRTGLLRIVQDATDPAIEAFAGIGLNLEEMQERMNALASEGGGGGDVIFFFDELSQKLNEIEGRGESAQAGLNDFAAAISKMVGVRSSARFLSFLKEIGDRYDENTTAGRAWIGVMADAQEAMRVYDFEAQLIEESAAGIADRLKAELNLELVRLGENFLGAANAARRMARDVLRWFNQLNPQVQRFVFVAGGAVAALGPLAMLLGIMTNAAGQFLTAITKFLPKFKLWTTATMAQKAAHDSSSISANLETTAQNNLAAARTAAATAARANTVATTAQASAMSGAAVAGGARVAAAGGGAMAGGGFSAVGASMGSILPKLSKFTRMLGRIPGIIGLIVTGFGLLSAAFNIETFVGAFTDRLAPAINMVRESMASLRTTISHTADEFKTLAEDSDSGMGTMARLAGEFMGNLGTVLAFLVDLSVKGIERITEAGGVAANVVGALIEHINGEHEKARSSWSRAGEEVATWGQRTMAILYDAAAANAEFWAEDMRKSSEASSIQERMYQWLIPRQDALAEKYRTQADALRESVSARDDLRALEHEYRNILSSNRDTLAAFNEGLNESVGLKRRMQQAGIEVNDLTREEILANENITDELKAQLVASLLYEESRARVIELETKLAELTQRIVTMARAGLQDTTFFSMAETELRALQEHYDGITGKVSTEYDRVLSQLRTAREVQGFFGDEVDETVESTKDLTDEIAAAEKKAGELRDRIRESERAAQEMASALRSGMTEVMNDIVAAVNDELNAQQQRMNDQFDARVQAIEDTANADLQRIAEQQKREEELERKRRRWFAQEKARIEYLKGMEQGNVQMQEALARGDVSDAAIIKIGLQRDAERFMLDSYEREAEAYRENRRDEIQSKQDAINETRKLAIAQIEMEREAAQKGYEARRQAVQNYLRDWQRITPATEAEFRRHLGALTRNMNGFGVNMANVTSRYTNIAGSSIVTGFARATDLAAQAVAESRKWNAAGQTSGARFRAGLARELAKVESDLDALRSGKNVNISSSGLGSPTKVSTPSFTSNIAPIQTGWQAGTDWSTGANQSMSAADFSPNRPVGGQRATGGSMLAMHTGGKITTTPNMPGLRPDEQAYILQRGEFVVQKNAVDAVGPGYLEMLNQMKKHDGGLINFAGSTITEGNILGAMAGFGLGGLATMAASDIVSAGGGKPKQAGMSDDVGPGRGIGIKAGEQISDALSKFMAFAMEGDSAGWRPSSSGWPPRRWATISPNTAAARDYWRSRGQFPGGIGDGVHRGVESSDHSWGKALDFMVAPLGRYAQGAQKQLGWAIANWHLQNPNAFGTKYVIWDKLINSGDSRGWRDYSRYGPNPGPTLGHYDHVHVSYMHDGGMVPSLRTGGKIKFDNTLANLHRGERVLTEPSTKALEAAIQNFAGGMGSGGDTYEITINVDGTGLDENKLASKIMDKIELQEVRKGRKRVHR